MSWLSRDLRRSRVTSSVVSLLVLCVVVLGALFVPAGADSDPDPAAVEGASSLGRELPAMRTRTSRTYVGQDGGRVSRLFTQSVNFKDSAGNWRKIDNGLESTADGYANRENRYRVELPKDLAEPVRVSKDGAWVEYALEGAASAGTADRATARYRGALAGVDVSYTAASDAVKESFSLAGPESKRVSGSRSRRARG